MQELLAVLNSGQQETTTVAPIYGGEGEAFDISDPFNFQFFRAAAAKQAATNPQQTTKIAAGGYIDDLLAGDMTVDDLLNLLR